VTPPLAATRCGNVPHTTTTDRAAGHCQPDFSGQYPAHPRGGACSSSALAAGEPRGVRIVPRRDRRSVLIDADDAAPGFAVKDEDTGSPDG
jgi:hypothetical protein